MNTSDTAVPESVQGQTVLARIRDQERILQLKSFDLADAWQLGSKLRELALSRAASLAILVRLGGESAFACCMPGTTPVHLDWARRKANTVELFQCSSYAMACTPPENGKTMVEFMGLSPRDYATAGGGFPIIVHGVGCVGVAAVSGLPQRDDHELIVEALASLCKVELLDVALKS